MSYSIVGEQIQKFRKELGLTQKELGESIGVSSSAVSQWESGGTPDISLLPAIADKLHVTIDALFGREGGEVMDVKEIVGGWFKTLPEGQRLEQTCRLSFEILKNIAPLPIQLPEIGFMKDSEIEDDNGIKSLLPSVVFSDEGLTVGVFAEDMSFASFFPEPAAGYDTYLSPCEDYQDFFQTLSEPGVLEVILSLAAEKLQYFTPGAVAKRAGVSEARAKEALELLRKHRLTDPLELESDEGEISAYVLRKQVHLVPFLYFARMMAEPSDGMYYINCGSRFEPVLRGKKQ